MVILYIMLPTYHRDLIQGGALLPPRKLMRGEIMLQPPMMGGFMDVMEMRRMKELQEKNKQEKEDRELRGEPEPERRPSQHSDFDTPVISDPRFQKVKQIPLKKLGEGIDAGLITLGVPKPIAKKIGKESMHNIDMMSSGNTQDLFDAPVMKALDPVQKGFNTGLMSAMTGVSDGLSKGSSAIGKSAKKTGKKIKKAFK
jgi:hypothetical protein